MKNAMMILTLCITLVGTTSALAFSDVTPQAFQGNSYSVVAWGDVDGNGTPDLFLGCADNGHSRLFLNMGSSWTNVTDTYGVSNINHVTSARFADYDQDGMLDLLCLTDDGSGIELYRQTANHRYQPVELNFEEESSAGIHAAMWCDANDDGVFDLMLSNRSRSNSESVLLVPTSDEFIEERGADGPFAESGVKALSCIDFDQDGDLDYFISKDEGTTTLWTNQDGRFADLGSHLGFEVKMGQDGVTWGDFNRDGKLDFYACGSPNNSCLYYQRGATGELPFSFQDMTDYFDFRPLTPSATSASAVDINGDGWTDLFLASRLGNIVLMNDHGRAWIQSERITHLQQTNRGTRSVAWADFDGDGDLDVAMAQGRNGVRLFRNDRAMNHEFISLDLCGSGESMTPALNCLVQVVFPYGKQWAATSMYTASNGGDDMTQILYNPSYYHSEEWTVHILWSNGLVTTLDEMDIPLNGVMTVHMPETPSADNNMVVTPMELPEVANYPNPFNPTTNISFNLSESAYISLSIYNLLGQEVANLASGQYEAGQHSLVFDASALPSGLYMARLEAPSGSVVHRMLLTK
ncbi:MAG: T9SS type A sorting domain-containing protein [Calditrichaeota bacterium]|nr:T9SS type A sorting domain-containing protein [Calditrichota bacterium]MCB9369453.1 T9SS type A sorting domain-containing protein [Calditrichota bacterium]